MTNLLPPALRPLGSTGLQVTALCVGCAPLGNMPETFAYSVPEAQALDTLRASFASAINFLDTAASYGDGESERRIGLALRELGGVPPGVVIATKADRDMRTGDFSGDQIKRSVERSLKLLGLARLPLVYLHDPEHTTFENVLSAGGPLETLQRFKAEGVIGAVGLAGGPIEMELRYAATGAFEVIITHNRYTLLNRSAEPLIALAAAQGLALVNAAPYGSGLLATGPRPGARYAYQTAPPEILGRAQRLAEICERHAVPLAAAALQFSLRDPRITSTIVGMSRPERVKQTLALARHPIPADLWEEVDAVGFATTDPEAGRWR